MSVTYSQPSLVESDWTSREPNNPDPRLVSSSYCPKRERSTLDDFEMMRIVSELGHGVFPAELEDLGVGIDDDLFGLERA
jgi:hypothetical protein